VLHADVRGERGDRVVDRVPHDRDPRAVILELVAEFAVRVERVVLDHDGAEPEHGVERDDVLRAIRQHEGHAVALLHAELAETLRHARDLLGEVAIGRLRAEELGGDSAPVTGDRPVQHVDEGLRGFGDLGGNAVRVSGQPGLVVEVGHDALSGRGLQSTRGRMELPVHCQRPADAVGDAPG
jgi:hypothetical protein